MVHLYLIKFHKILDNHKVEVAVVTVDSILINMVFAVFIEPKELKIPMFVINGEKDISKDNETYNDYLVVSYFWWRYKARHI